ncbi:MAG: sensor histidine kinase [Balneola sp.]
MAQNKHIISVDTPKNFNNMLFGLWVFFTISLGTVSTWVFTNLDPETMNGMWWDGYLFSAIYAFLFLLFFRLSWNPLVKKFPLHKKNVLFIHGTVQALVSVLGFGLGFIITESIHGLLYDHSAMESSKSEIGLTLIALFCLVGILMTNGFFYSTAYMRRSMDAEKRRVDSELSALRAQINPHFLFNSLNSIAALIRISPSEAEAVTEDLADVFRYTLRASETPMVCLKDELEIINLYLNIEKARFKERLTVNIQVPDTLLNVSVPVLTLQPLVENSIKHGVSKKEGNHTITVSISSNNDLIELAVSDTGPGFPHNNFEKLLEKGTGLSNVFQRLKLHFGDEVDGAILEHSLILRFPISFLDEHPHFEPKQKASYESIPG